MLEVVSVESSSVRAPAESSFWSPDSRRELRELRGTDGRLTGKCLPDATENRSLATARFVGLWNWRALATAAIERILALRRTGTGAGS
eukprot:1220615-Rhodomonas_salina.1